MYTIENPRRLLSFARRAIDDFAMIDAGDRLALGLSGGKDSLSLLVALAKLREFYPKKYELCAITVDLGFRDKHVDYTQIRSLCSSLGVEHIIVPSNIGPIVFEARKESNPCSLCAKLRRGILNGAALQRGCNKVALAHHMDDAVETFYMNLLLVGRIDCFQAATYLDRSKLTVIRPLIYMPEKLIRAFARDCALPVLSSCCPSNGRTERQAIKEWIAAQSADFDRLKTKTFGAMLRRELLGKPVRRGRTTL